MQRKILLADDSLTIQKVVELTFVDSNYRLTSVSNGRLALEKARLDPPDLILADVVMPEKNGYEVCEEIKRDPATSRIPVILLAGTFEPFDRERAERLGCDAIVRKPFDSRDLFRKVDALLGGGPGRPRARGEAPVVADAAESGPAPDIAEHFTPAPPNPFDAGFAEEDFTGSIRTVRSGGRSRSEPRSDAGESLAGLYGPEDVDSALAAFREVETAAGSAGDRNGRRSTDPVPEPRITRDSLARFLDEAAADNAAMREAAAPAERNEERTRKIDVSGFRPLAAGEREKPPGEPTVEIRRDDFFVPDPAARRETPIPAASSAPEEPTPEEPVPPLPTAGTVAPEGFASAAEETQAAGPAASRELTDAEIDRLADRVAQKVLEKLSDRVVREVAWEVVPDTAQLVVRERIRELESGVD